jgi:hypothetical protein
MVENVHETQPLTKQVITEEPFLSKLSNELIIPWLITTSVDPTPSSAIFVNAKKQVLLICYFLSKGYNHSDKSSQTILQLVLLQLQH